MENLVLDSYQAAEVWRQDSVDVMAADFVPVRLVERNRKGRVIRQIFCFAAQNKYYVRITTGEKFDRWNDLNRNFCDVPMRQGEGIKLNDDRILKLVVFKEFLKVFDFTEEQPTVLWRVLE